jgi:mRNA interferase MazF
MTEGDIALTPLPQSDRGVKARPAVLLRRMPPFGDWLVCGISTQLHQQVVGFDEVIAPSHPDFADSGLKAPSLIRLGFLAVVPSGQFLGVLGSVADDRHARLLQKLSAFLAAEQRG